MDSLLERMFQEKKKICAGISEKILDAKLT